MNSLVPKTPLRRVVRIVSGVLVLCALLAPNARADTVGSSQVQNTRQVFGSYSEVFTLNVNGPGVLTIKLENISWPERLSQLDCSIFSKDGFMEGLAGSGEWKFVSTGPASFYASVLASSQGRFNLGLFSIRMTFESAASLVPLPGAVWLLGSVLGLFGVRRHAWPALRFALNGERLA
ncbi:MAG: hypothetical protein WDO72_17200 [Pseudomonadota bacterium]